MLWLLFLLLDIIIFSRLLFLFICWQYVLVPIYCLNGTYECGSGVFAISITSFISVYYKFIFLE